MKSTTSPCQALSHLESRLAYGYVAPDTPNMLVAWTADASPLAQVAAVDEPKLHLWDSGVIRITRHPQVRRQRFLRHLHIRVASRHLYVFVMSARD